MIQTLVLDNGLRLVAERLPYLRSASAGLFLKAGSMLETPGENGLSHFIEHMAFKGTQGKNARQIAEEIDLLGGNVNAGTSKVATSYYARTTDKDLRRSLQLLADLTARPAVKAEDFEKERQVVLEEIAMEADTPEDLVFNLSHRAVFGEQSLSRTILGGRDAISGYTVQELTRFMSRFYQPANAVLSVTGRFEFERLAEWAREAFSGWEGGQTAEYPPNAPLEGVRTLVMDKDTEQAHLCVSYPGVHSLHPDRHALAILSTALGGGVSSRLFQRVREERGLVYNIYSMPAFYPACGEFIIYAACAPGKLVQVLDLVRQETDDLARHGLQEKEFEQARAQMETGFVLGMESAYQRMSSLGMNLLMHEKIVTPRETLRKMRAVSRADAGRVARDILGGDAKYAFVGRQVAKHLKKKGIAIDGQA